MDQVSGTFVCLYYRPWNMLSVQGQMRNLKSDQGAVSIRKTVLPGMAIPMLKIRRPNGRLIFNMEITIRRKDGLYIETGPWCPCCYQQGVHPNLVRAWISNYIHVKEWDVIIHPYPNFNGSLADIRNSNFSWYFALKVGLGWVECFAVAK